MILSLDGPELIELRLAGHPVLVSRRLPSDRRHWSHGGYLDAAKAAA